jgi:uncharacterized protein YcfJ
MRAVSIILALAFVVMVLGCTTEEKTAVAGGAIGAGAGAIIGHQSGHTTEGALIGGTVGLIGGYLYGKSTTVEQADGTIVEVVECPKCGATLQFAAHPEPERKVRCHCCQTVFIRQNVKVMTKTHTITHIKEANSPGPPGKDHKPKPKGWEKKGW